MACGKQYNVARNMQSKSITDTEIDSFSRPHYISTYHGKLVTPILGMAQL